MGGGGGSYSDDVNFVRQTSSTQDFSDISKEEITKKHEPDPGILPINFPGVEIYTGQDLVVIWIDGTGSMGEDAFIIRDKIVLLEGQLRIQGYLKDPLVMICMVGDGYSDRWPIQVTKPERGDALIAEIEKTFPEGGGGDQGMESYDLMAYYMVRYVELDDKNARPFLFILGDEGIYPEVNPRHVEKFIGDGIEAGIKSETIFRQLRQKFNVFLLHRQYYSSPGEDEEIVKQWKEMIGNERVQRLTKPKEVVDDILGIIAVGTGARTIGRYLDDMRARGQTSERIKDVRKVLVGAEQALIPIKDVPKLPGVVRDETKERSSGSKRL